MTKIKWTIKDMRSYFVSLDSNLDKKNCHKQLSSIGFDGFDATLGFSLSNRFQFLALFVILYTGSSLFPNIDFILSL